MPPTVSRHRPGPSFDDLLSQLDENQLHLLLTDLNNSRDVHIPVAKAINFYEKPRSRRHGHGLPTKRAVSSPLLPPSHFYHDTPGPRAAVPPMPTAPAAMTTPTARNPLLSLSPPTEDIDTPTTPSHSKRVSLAPLPPRRQHSLHRLQTTEVDPASTPPVTCEETPPQTTAKTSRAYKRISRPALAALSTAAAQGQDIRALLAAHLFSGGSISESAARSDSAVSLSSSRSMVDLRLFERLQQEEDYYRPRDVLEPMVQGAGAQGSTSPSVLGKPLLRDATGMVSLFAVLNGS